MNVNSLFAVFWYVNTFRTIVVDFNLNFWLFVVIKNLIWVSYIGVLEQFFVEWWEY